MRALVVYESMYGNTHVVASNVADGLRYDYEVTLVPVAKASAELAEHAARRRGLVGPSVGHDAGCGE